MHSRKETIKMLFSLLATLKINLKSQNLFKQIKSLKKAREEPLKGENL